METKFKKNDMLDYSADLKLKATQLNNLVAVLESMAYDMDTEADIVKERIEEVGEVTLIHQGTPKEKWNQMLSIVEIVMGGKFRDELEKLSYEVNYDVK